MGFEQRKGMISYCNSIHLLVHLEVRGSHLQVLQPLRQNETAWMKIVAEKVIRVIRCIMKVEPVRLVDGLHVEYRKSGVC